MLQKTPLFASVQWLLLIGSSLSWMAWNAHAQVIAPSRYATGIQVAGDPPEPAGQEFDDWAGLPIALTDPEDNPSFLNLTDIRDVQIANDDDFIYIRVSYYNSNSAGAFLAFDTDQELATGFDIFGLGLVGSELGYVNDFVFDQRDPLVFNQNTNGGNTCCIGGPLDLNNGGALLFPAFDQPGIEREWAIPLDASFSEIEPFGPTFPHASFDFIVWTDQGLTDVTEVISYTLATNPNPGGAGDFDGSLTVGNGDLTLLLDGWGGAPGPGWVTDVPVSVGNESLTILLDNWGNDYSSGTLAALASVPEPTSLSLLAALLGWATLCRRHDD